MRAPLAMKRFEDARPAPARPTAQEITALVASAEAFKEANPDADISWPEMPTNRELPPGWGIRGEFDPYMTFYRRREAKGALNVAVSARVEADGRRWLHVSVSRNERMPSYQDMKDAKRIFVGPERIAYQVFAPESKHVNVHRFCLHLWCPLDGPVTPNFERGLGQI
jgi:hypothetical protein